MTTFTPIQSLGTFHVPAFKIALDAGTGEGSLNADVVDVTYTDDVDALDSFEFTLADWDPVTFEPVYSCPFDSSGKQKKYSGARGEALVPLLVPGKRLTLSMGYQDGGGQLVEMMRGSVVSLSSSFPSAGIPVAKVRVLNPLADYDKTPMKGKAKGGALDVLAAIAKALEIGFDDSTVPAETKAAHSKKTEPVVILSELKAAVDIRRLARSIGLNARLVTVGGKDMLQLSTRSDDAFALGWGRSLMSFTPTISTKQMVSRIVVRCQDPLGKSADKQKFEKVATWKDVTLTGSNALGAVLIDDVIKGLGKSETVITVASRQQMQDGFETAKAQLRLLASEMIRGAGQTVGLPLLRAGARVQISGVGSSFNGNYEVTKTTHTLGSAGYSTSFEGRKEIFA